MSPKCQWYLLQYYYNNNERRSEMNLDEYKAYVEATRKESLLKAIATMSEANDTMSSLFNTKEAN
jgi:hypothetical protein